MKLLNFITGLPVIVQAVGAVVLISGILVGGVAMSVVLDDPEEVIEYNFKSGVDTGIIPQISEDRLVDGQSTVASGPVKLEPVDPPKPEQPKTRVDTFRPEIKKSSPESKSKPLTAPTIVKKLVKKPPDHVLMATQVQNISPPDTDRSDELIRAFNARAFAFSGRDDERLTGNMVSVQTVESGTEKRKDLNRQVSWGIGADKNTYPTDLSRTITKEKLIRCITGNRIVSTLPGRIIVHVSENVYGAQGNLVLIPKGAKGSGYYSPVEKIGDERISIFIERFVVEADGQLILFSDPAMVGDQQGSSGITGEVDHKYAEKFGLPLIFSIANNLSNIGLNKIASAIEKASGGEDEDENLANQLFGAEWQRNQSATNQQIISEIIRQNVNISERVTIPAATEITVYLGHDVIFQTNKNGAVVGTRISNKERL